MLELPEIAQIARQAGSALHDRRIANVSLGTTSHKFLFLSRPIDELASVAVGRSIEQVVPDAKRIHVVLSGGSVLTFDEMGGQIRFCADEPELPKIHHFRATFEDGASLCVAIQGWGFCGVGSLDDVDLRQSRTERTNPLDESWTAERFVERVRSWPEHAKKTVKAALVCRHSVEGLGNGYLHDVLFLAGILPMRRLSQTGDEELARLHGSI